MPRMQATNFTVQLMPRSFLDAILKRRELLPSLRAFKKIRFHRPQSVTARCCSSTLTPPPND